MKLQGETKIARRGNSALPPQYYLVPPVVIKPGKKTLPESSPKIKLCLVTAVSKL